MEIEFLPDKAKKLKKYRHFTIPTVPVKETVFEGKTEFFYVGTDASKIDSLIKIFPSGYAAETPEKAILSLNRISESHKIPDLIIVDANLGERQIRHLCQYILQDHKLTHVPFVLETSELSDTQLEIFKKFQFLDEFFSLHKQDPEKLIPKIKFLQKVKSQLSARSHQKQIRRFQNGEFDRRIITKRAFDIIVCSLAVLILSPLFLLIAILIKLESQGPILYVSQRAGRGYRVFNFYKFRTMEIGADEKVQQLSHLNHYNASQENSPVFFKVKNDQRITRLGAFLRNSSLDELPQFFNVLIGNMSLVGNRPLPLYEAAKLTTDEWAVRFMAPAGITGLWQIKKKGYEKMSMKERIELDITYSHKYNFVYDLWIMANTPSALIQRSNA